MPRLFLVMMLMIGITSFAQTSSGSSKQKINWKQTGSASLRNRLVVAHDSGFISVCIQKQKLILEKYIDTTKNVKTVERAVKPSDFPDFAAWRLGDEFVVRLATKDSSYLFMHYDFELNYLHSFSVKSLVYLNAQAGVGKVNLPYFYPIDRIYASYEAWGNTYFFRKTVSDYSPTTTVNTPKNDLHYKGRFYYLWFDSQNDAAYSKKRKEKEYPEIEIWSLEWTRDTARQGYEKKWAVKTGMDEVTAYRFFVFSADELVLYLRGRNTESGVSESRIYRINTQTGKIDVNTVLLPEEGMEVLLCDIAADQTGDRLVFTGNYRWPIFNKNNGKNGWFIGFIDKKGNTRFSLQEYPDVPRGARKHMKNNPVLLFHGIHRMPDGRFAAAGELMGLSQGLIGNLFSGYNKARKRDIANPDSFWAITLSGFVVRFDADLEGITKQQFDFNRIQRWNFTGYKVPEPHRFFLGSQNISDVQYQHLPVYSDSNGIMQLVIVNPNEFRMGIFPNRRLMAYTLRITPSRAEMEPFKKLSIRKRRDSRLVFYGLGAPDGYVWLINQKAGKKKAQKVFIYRRKTPFGTEPTVEE
jgi:hypothetical protein